MIATHVYLPTSMEGGSSRRRKNRVLFICGSSSNNMHYEGFTQWFGLTERERERENIFSEK